MPRIRLTKDHVRRDHKSADSATDREQHAARNHPGATARTLRGLTERQWLITLLVVSGLLLLFTFRGCIIPTGIGPKNKLAVSTTPTPQVSSQPAGTEYTVVAGDTLGKIARQNNVSLEALAQANGIDLNQRVILRVGQKLQIPAGTPTP